MENNFMLIYPKNIHKTLNELMNNESTDFANIMVKLRRIKNESRSEFHRKKSEFSD